MKWNEFFHARKLLKRFVSMSLCIGMVSSQLLTGIPIQAAEETTENTTYNLPEDKTINPDITIQHYYNFPAMVLGNVEDEYNSIKKVPMRIKILLMPKIFKSISLDKEHIVIKENPLLYGTQRCVRASCPKMDKNISLLVMNNIQQIVKKIQNQ